jgi:hypothetical protein
MPASSRSVQQSEIELVAGSLDPSAIVWLHACHHTRASETGVVGLLQSHVLAHNYCQLTGTESAKPAAEFLAKTLRAHVDAYAGELEANRLDQVPLGVDKSLASEVFSHFEVLNELSKCSESVAAGQAGFEACLDGYLDVGCLTNARASGALLIESGHGEEAVSRYVGGRMELARPLNVRGGSLHVFRFCARTVVSSDLRTVIQSVAQQVCYLLEIHESWAFDVSDGL